MRGSGWCSAFNSARIACPGLFGTTSIRSAYEPRCCVCDDHARHWLDRSRSGCADRRMGEAHGRTIDVRWIEKALATAEARGMREEVASLRAGLVCDARKRISAAQHCEIWERLAKRAGRSTFPIEVAESMSLGDYDLL